MFLSFLLRFFLVSTRRDNSKPGNVQTNLHPGRLPVPSITTYVRDGATLGAGDCAKTPEGAGKKESERLQTL
jgi:hypothetical protein